MGIAILYKFMDDMVAYTSNATVTRYLVFWLVESDHVVLFPKTRLVTCHVTREKRYTRTPEATAFY